jgi:type VI secretion system protein ImpL
LKFLRKIFRWRPWMRWPLWVLILGAFSAGVWYGGELAGIWPLSTVWLRLSVIGVVLGIFALVQVIKWRRRVKKAALLEKALVVEPPGDGKELAGRMTQALATLKKTGGKAYLYDLPWYIIIGPPGAGKTTALKNAGIEFPLMKSEGGVVEGFGGTRYCDWWFAEDAVLIDTAGRYTTQDSDQVSDSASWAAFLDLLKKSRPNQPINGVLLAFSVSDMMNATDETMTRHAETVRARLGEIHEALKIDFPVYVLFTKADLIAGFREYFASFNQNRRKVVWGTTFQTKDRKAETWPQVGAEYDRLVARLSDEVMDRLSEEPDPVNRIAIFGLPGQMALLRDNVASFLQKVFEPTRYKTNAILRGFYFGSGTQEGTPIDQVLGEMARAGGGGFAPAFMSGQGKSYFLHDLLKKVIFAERDWVSTDKQAVRRAAVLRGVGLGAVGLATVGALGALGLSFWQNRQLVMTAQVEAADYARAAQTEIARTEVDTTDLLPILDLLDRLRNQPAGYGAADAGRFGEGFGLGQRARLTQAATESYGDALEQMLRPRLILDTEQRLGQFEAAGDTSRLYRALKVYMLLGKQGGQNDDPAIVAWFGDVWRETFNDLDGVNQRDRLTQHLTAMLELDDDRDVTLPLDEAVITRARSAIVQMSVADQAWSVITANAAASQNLPPLSFGDTSLFGPNVGLVFQTTDGTPLEEVTVDGLYRYEGFWSFFVEQLSDVQATLEADKWVLGDQANLVDFDAQLASLDVALTTRYGREFKASWDAALGRLKLGSMSADKPAYDALGEASGASSPLMIVAQTIVRETALTAEIKALEGLTPGQIAGTEPMPEGASAAGASLGGDVLDLFRARSGRVQRMLMDAATAGAKNQTQVGGAAGGGGGVMRPIEQIEDQFEPWALILQGEPGQRPMDLILADLAAIRDNLRVGAANPAQAAALMPQLLSNLTRQNSRLPEPLAGWVSEAENDFRGEANDATLAEMNRALANDITFTCRDNIAALYPFTNTQRHLPPGAFGQFFGQGGAMDTYFNTYLAPMVIRTENGLEYDPANPLSEKLNPATLKEFERAEDIRRAFFADGGMTPKVTMGVTHITSHATVESAQLEINGTSMLSAPGDPPTTIEWPGSGASASIQLFPSLNTNNAIEIREGPWSVLRLLRAASSVQQNGTVTRATWQIGGRPVVYEFSYTASDDPFLMDAIRQFGCPAALD